MNTHKYIFHFVVQSPIVAELAAIRKHRILPPPSAPRNLNVSFILIQPLEPIEHPKPLGWKISPSTIETERVANFRSFLVKAIEILPRFPLALDKSFPRTPIEH